MLLFAMQNALPLDLQLFLGNLHLKIPLIQSSKTTHYQAVGRSKLTLLRLYFDLYATGDIPAYFLKTVRKAF